MAEALLLDLRAELRYAESGQGDSLNFDGPWPFTPLPEGREELYGFDEGDLIRNDPDEGPRLRLPLPPARCLGKGEMRAARTARTAASPAAPAADPVAADGYSLAAGSYAFMQTPVTDLAGLVEAMESFVRDCWWQGLNLRGPLLLRRVGEDGATALQLLRRVELG